MCVILSCKTVFPDLRTLCDAERANPHGSGCAWVENDKVVWRKGVSAKLVHEMIVAGIIKLPAVIHFRLATVGACSNELCHPFVIEENSPIDSRDGTSDKTLLFHNGHWNHYSDAQRVLKLEGQVSDSRVLAAWLHRVGADHAETLLEQLGNSNRFVTLSPNDGPVLYGKWFRSGDIDYSNLYFRNTCRV